MTNTEAMEYAIHAVLTQFAVDYTYSDAQGTDPLKLSDFVEQTTIALDALFDIRDMV